VASTATDSDFVVKLIDVYPDDFPNPESDSLTPQVQMGGYEQLVRGEPMRAKFRDSWEMTLPPQNVSLSKLFKWRKGHEDDEGNAWSLHA
jgi:hypothetical protein